jgi:isopentenyl diphosphate isomerase/L-lactate dehydrogenase-like FMN-dependent dehydrogenase
VAGVAGRIPVLVDSGFRRGTDVFKALALGASAVCIGRPYVWGLAGFGQAGVTRTFELLARELELVMRQAGTRTLNDITSSSVIDRGRW